MINFYLKCHKCGGIQFTVLAVTDYLKQPYYNVVCIHDGYESTIMIENGVFKAEETKT